MSYIPPDASPNKNNFPSPNNNTPFVSKCFELFLMCKVVFTTESVVCGWAGAVTHVKSPFGVNSHSGVDGPTKKGLF